MSTLTSLLPSQADLLDKAADQGYLSYEDIVKLVAVTVCPSSIDDEAKQIMDFLKQNRTTIKKSSEHYLGPSFEHLLREVGVNPYDCGSGSHIHDIMCSGSSICNGIETILSR